VYVRESMLCEGGEVRGPAHTFLGITRAPCTLRTPARAQKNRREIWHLGDSEWENERKFCEKRWCEV
jgi:hypothetical protein